jgi:hypothetical protein
LSREVLNQAEGDTSVIGPAIWPKAVKVKAQDGSLSFEVHRLDLTNVGVLDSGWAIGSCPHLFFESARSQRLVYASDLFNRVAGVSQEHVLVAPEGGIGLVVAELEDERTLLQELEVDGKTVARNVTLIKGDAVRVEIASGARVRLRGYYEPLGPTEEQPWLRNCIIATYLREKSAGTDHSIDLS